MDGDWVGCSAGLCVDAVFVHEGRLVHAENIAVGSECHVHKCGFARYLLRWWGEGGGILFRLLVCFFVFFRGYLLHFCGVFSSLPWNSRLYDLPWWANGLRACSDSLGMGMVFPSSRCIVGSLLPKTKYLPQPYVNCISKTSSSTSSY